MSKIYEALLRAELDRLDDSQEGAEADGRSGITVTTATEPELFKDNQPDTPTAANTLTDERSAIQNDVPHFRRSVWEPDFHWLPSLLLQGTLLEQFHNLRSHLYELRAQKPLKSILVSSGLPQEGKSFIAVNLALTLAMHHNNSVLLIDGDMRRYSLHKTLGCASGPGLAEYLSGKAALQDVMQQTEPLHDETNLQKSRLQALTFIAGGNDVETAADLSANGRFHELISAASQQFDWIIVDSSPVNLVSDAINLARACDGVLLVARAGSTQIPAAQHAVNELKGSSILGFVLNGFAAPSDATAYYSYASLEKQSTQI